jgi:cell division transport system permease protein
VWRSPGTVLGSFLSLLLLFLLFDLYWITANSADQFYDNMLSELRMELFISEDAPDSTLAIVREAIAAAPGVHTAEYVSRQAARDELARLVGIDLLVGYDSANPLPRSFVIDFDAGHRTGAQIAAIAADMRMRPDITDVYYSQHWLESAETTRGILVRVGMGLGVLILLTALITSVNSIRLGSRARALGLQQMRLLGAGKLMLAGPFLIEAGLVGGLSAAAGWAAILYAQGLIDFSRVELVLPTYAEIALFCGITAVLGIISGYLGIRKLLR